MLKNYLKIAFRHIKRNKVFSLINFTGLIVGMTVSLLIFLFLKNELSYDGYHKNVDSIYRILHRRLRTTTMGSNLFAYTPSGLAHALKDDCPEVLSAVRLKPEFNVLLSSGKETFLENDFYFADSDMFNVFSFDLDTGDPRSALKDLNSIILSESAAVKYFGRENPLGKELILKNFRGTEAFPFRVAGVLKNIPKNSHFIPDFIAPYQTLISIMGRNSTDWNPYMFCVTYCRVREGTDPEEFDKKLRNIVKTYIETPDNKSTKRREFFLQPLKDIHLTSNINGEFSSGYDRKNIAILLAVAVMVLLIACINYVNLVTARSLKRAKEVGVRKVVGAQKKQLIQQFIGESLLFTIIVFFLSILVVSAVLPSFNSFVERDLSLASILDTKGIVCLLAVILFTGLASGIYPAFFVSSLKPVSIFKKGIKTRSKKISLRSVLVVFQFSVSIVLIVCTLVVKDQLKFIKSTDAGFNRDQIVTIQLRDPNARQNLKILREELKKYPDIINSSGSANLPNNIMSWNSSDIEGQDERFVFYISEVDYDFINLFDIKIVEGRNFSRDFPSDENGAVLVNETAVRALGWDFPLEKKIKHWNGKEAQVIGVVKDFHLHSFHHSIAPLYLYLNSQANYSLLSVKIKPGNLHDSIKILKEEVKKFSSQYPFEYSFFDEVFDRAYRAEGKMESLFNIFALVSIFISCIGLFGLSLFMTEQRTSEIGIRKVFGASVSGITLLLSREFIRWLVLANIAAWPVSYYFMRQWLQNFAYRTGLGIRVFLFSGILALFVALLTVSYQSVKAALANPIDAIRYE